MVQIWGQDSKVCKNEQQMLTQSVVGAHWKILSMGFTVSKHKSSIKTEI